MESQDGGNKLSTTNIGDNTMTIDNAYAANAVLTKFGHHTVATTLGSFCCPMAATAKLCEYLGTINMLEMRSVRLVVRKSNSSSGGMPSWDHSIHMDETVIFSADFAPEKMRGEE